MTVPLTYPTKVYDFTGFSQTRPSQQVPGDRLDAQFENHAGVIASLVDTIGNLTTQLVTLSQLDPAALEHLQALVRDAAAQSAQRAISASVDATDASNKARASELNAQQAAVIAQGAAALLPGGSADVTAAFAAAEMRANEVTSRIHTIASLATNAENDAAKAAATAEDWANVSIAWAEYMPEDIPPNILAIVGVSGEHWSSRWWANQADLYAQGAEGSVADAVAAAEDAAAAAADAAAAAADAAATAEEMGDLYLGAHPTAPTADNDGDPLQVGTLYYNSTIDVLYVWDGAGWQAVTTPSGSGIAASAVIVAPVGTISSTNAQAAFAELSAEKLDDAPNDGAIYGRRNHAWTVSTAASIAWTDITGKPATFPPSVHTHPTSEVVGLDAALAAAATDADLAAEASTRAAADTTLQGNINTVAGNLTTETTNRTNADTALQTQITTNANNLATEITNRTADVDAEEAARIAADTTLQTNINAKPSEAPNDGKQYARQSLGWTAVIGGASVADTPPSSPLANQLWWEANSGNLYIYYNDGNSSQWVQVNHTANPSSFVTRSGDTMTGPLVLPADPTLPLQSATKQYVDATAIAPAAPSAFGHRNGAGATGLATNAWTKINISSVSINVGGWTLNTQNMIVPKTGTYLVGASVAITAVATATALLVGVGVNSATVPQVDARVQNPAVAGSWYLNCQRVINLTAGDALTLLGYSSVAGNSVSDGNDSTFLWATMVAA